MRRDHAHLLSAASEAMDRKVSWWRLIRHRGGGTEGPRGQLNCGCGCAPNRGLDERRRVGAPKPEPHQKTRGSCKRPIALTGQNFDNFWPDGRGKKSRTQWAAKLDPAEFP